MASIGFPPEMELQKMLSMFDSEDVEAQTQAIEFVANLSLEVENHKQIVEAGGIKSFLILLRSRKDENILRFATGAIAMLAIDVANHKQIVEGGGVKSLLMLMRSTQDELIHRFAAGAIGSLAMDEINDELIVNQGGISLLSSTAASFQDPETLKIVIAIIANFCGIDRLQTRLRSEGGIAALLGTIRCGHPDVLVQVARGMENLAQCESRALTQGAKSILIEDGALSWIVQNAKAENLTIKMYIESTLCHLAEREVNADDMVKEGAMWKLVRISKDSSREDLKILSHRILTSSPIFLTELKRVCLQLRNTDGTPIYCESNLEMTIENDLLQHINTIYEVVLEAEKENVIKATFYKGKEQLVKLVTTILETTTWAEELKIKLGVTSKWIKKD